MKSLLKVSLLIVIVLTGCRSRTELQPVERELRNLLSSAAMNVVQLPSLEQALHDSDFLEAYLRADAQPNGILELILGSERGSVLRGLAIQASYGMGCQKYLGFATSLICREHAQLASEEILLILRPPVWANLCIAESLETSAVQILIDCLPDRPDLASSALAAELLCDIEKRGLREFSVRDAMSSAARELRHVTASSDPFRSTAWLRIYVNPARHRAEVLALASETTAPLLERRLAVMAMGGLPVDDGIEFASQLFGQVAAGKLECEVAEDILYDDMRFRGRRFDEARNKRALIRMLDKVERLEGLSDDARVRILQLRKPS